MSRSRCPQKRAAPSEAEDRWRFAAVWCSNPAMKTLTEFSTLTLRKAAAARATVPAKKPESPAAQAAAPSEAEAPSSDAPAEGDAPAAEAPAAEAGEVASA